MSLASNRQLFWKRTKNKHTHENSTNKLWKNICFVLLDIFAKQIFRSRKFPLCLFNVLCFYIHRWYFSFILDVHVACYSFSQCLDCWFVQCIQNASSNIPVSPFGKFHFITWFSNIFLCVHTKFIEEISCLNIWCCTSVPLLTLQQTPQ